MPRRHSGTDVILARSRNPGYKIGAVGAIQGLEPATGSPAQMDLSYASNLEDYHLSQVFGDQAHGCYIDVGAGHPVAGNVSSFQPKAEQDVVRIYEDTVLAFEKLATTDTGNDEISETQLDLRSGKIFGTVKKLTPTSRYEIKLPNGVAGVRGTIYTISADGVVQVLVGSVVISWVAPDGTAMTQTVNGGFQFDARTGLITPIPDYDQQEMVKAAKENRLGPNTPPKSFVEDRTIYYVSPTQGHNGNAGSDGPPPE